MKAMLQQMLDSGCCPVLVGIDGQTMEISSVNDSTAYVTFANGCAMPFPLRQIDERLCDGRLSFKA